LIQLIIHLDIKPDNILLNKKGGIKISDFGISIKQSISKGSYQGSAHYMAVQLSILFHVFKQNTFSLF
jgi:serine/threonine protein kinase